MSNAQDSVQTSSVVHPVGPKSQDEDSVLVFNIQGYSIQDGPGVRTTVFLKGCPLRCAWCSNPESQTTCDDVLHVRTKCARCFRCVERCPHNAVSMPDPSVGEDNFYPVIDHAICSKCSEHDCVLGCYSDALENVGRLFSVDKMVDRVLDDANFFTSGDGGVTFSGGEPLMHARWLAKVLRECKENYIHTAIETTGYHDWGEFSEVLRYTDLVLYDLKHMDSEKHRAWTGVGNELILDNLRKVASETDCDVWVRIPTIPGVNDDEENIAASADFVRSIGLPIIHLLPYHNFGSGKYLGLSRSYPMGMDLKTPSDEQMNSLKRVVESRGVRCNIGGAA